MDTQIQKFDPLKKEVADLVEQIKTTVISLPSGNTGYALMTENKRLLQKKRKEVTDTMKSEREQALAFQKMVIAYEKDILALIEPVESDLKAKIEAIDAERELNARKALLPERMARLQSIPAYEGKSESAEEYILTLDNIQFESYFNQEMSAYNNYQAEQIRLKAEEDARKLKEEQDKLAEAQRKHDEEIRIEWARKQAEKEAQEKAIKDAELAKLKAEQDKLNALKKAEEDKARAVKEAEEKAERERQALIAEQKRKDDERIAAEKKIEDDRKAKVAAEFLEQKRIENNKKYTSWLGDNGYTLQNKDEFIINKIGDTHVMYKKISEITIK